jgi:3-methyl-2-oxobutanoate hydroxymethyltransferase
MTNTSESLTQKKVAGEPIAVLTCYDYPTARCQDEAGVDIIFVGDSVGTNVLGYSSEKEVTLEDMAHHLKAVRRGVEHAYLLADLPYGTYDTPEQAAASASRLTALGADGVKLEGFRPDVVRRLVAEGIEVCAHLGLNPQLHARKGLRAKTAAAAAQLVSESIELQAAGAWIIVYEMIPEEVGRIATERLSIPTIGIAAGRHTDGQVLVAPDLLGINTFDLRHVRRYDDLHSRTVRAFESYIADVRSGGFPDAGNVRHLDEAELQALRDTLSPGGDK